MLYFFNNFIASSLSIFVSKLFRQIETQKVINDLPKSTDVEDNNYEIVEWLVHKDTNIYILLIDVKQTSFQKFIVCAVSNGLK